MIEMLQKSKFGYFLATDSLQFGFKPNISTSHAIYTLKNTSDYFSNNHSRIFLAFLDCSKAFDRISHWGLFIKLMKRNVPLCFLMTVMFLYLNMTCDCKWNRVKSRVFEIPSGTKQGGILSPDFFSLYIDDLISLLKASGFGCHMINICISAIFFADDVVLLSPSLSGLQKLIDICVSYCSTFCLDFNIKKSKIMVEGERLCEDQLSPVTLNGLSLDYVTEYRKYQKL